MRLSRLILCGLVVLAAAHEGHAGPLRRLFGGRGCGGCQPPALSPRPASPPAVLWSPHQQAVTVGDQVRATPVTVATSYSGAGVPVDATPYQPIRLTAPLPVCGPLGCPK